MTVHIGEIIRKLVEDSNVPRNKIAKCINTVESNLYKIYEKPEVRIGHLINMSPILRFNLLEPYFELEELKGIANSQWNTMKRELEEKNSQIEQYKAALTAEQKDDEKWDILFDLLRKDNEELKDKKRLLEEEVSRYHKMWEEQSAQNVMPAGEEEKEEKPEEIQYKMKRAKKK